ncbi:hypothetical protein AAFN85_08520 [Mucilaginibacter sp. CAU 1740]|uniref:hypothetical protein n=1 Tax=Mucilaginibacter sp. CAU 1740 TaxID=3140365 RepID=UPI00325B26B0
MVRTILKPERNSLTIKLPDNFVGKVIEVIAFEIEQNADEQVATEEKKKRIEDLNKVLNKHRVDLTNFKFDRDEANDYE